MALPPLSNIPFLNKFFRTDQAAATGKAKAAGTQAVSNEASVAADIVEISAAARQGLEGIEELSSVRAGEVAAAMRERLAESDLALGLDPSFS